MLIFDRESSLLTPVGDHLRRRGFRRQCYEVQFFEYSMDLYGYARRTAMTMAVELKLTRWTRAFEQALVYQLCADLVYLALPFPATTRVDLALLTQHGLGLIGVRQGPRCLVLLDAQPSAVVIPDYRDFYIRFVEEQAP